MIGRAVQQVLTIKVLPESGLEASAAFMSEHLEAARELLAADQTTSLVIALPKAAFDHDDWRDTLARDLARRYAPKRVNVVGGEAPDALITYLEGASGVTGQYLATHE